MKIQKPKRISLTSQIVQEMERIIRSGEWKVGECIPPEPELVRMFGVSRNTVREALQSLIHAGLLMARPGDGTYVMGINRMEILMHSKLSSSEINRILEARLVLEIGIAGLAAENRTDEDIAGLRAALEKRNATSDPAPDSGFHIAVAAATHNPLLADFYNEICLYMQKTPLCDFASDSVRSREILLHGKLVDTIEKGDSEKAKAVTAEIVGIYAGRMPRRTR